MNNRLILFFCLALIFSTTNTFAQLSKQEKKEWKKKAKEFSKNPANLKSLTEEKAAAESQVASLNQKLTQLQSSVSDKDARLAELEDQLSQTRAQLTTAKAELTQLKETPVINPMDFSKGVVFKVQIGAFKNKDLAKYFENNPNFGGEVKEGEPQKITIGIFRDYWEADTFKKYMREMGVKDAWIVPYRDGQRVEIKDVLEGVVGDKPAEGTN
ncbi:Ezrin/radixin/moesin family protein [Fulvivirgaceae bacterium PWU4]|uniref:Ezrin/radixin/moesin family protein n=1 Tax=Chryseosolibacter histidini TaxID=2782349 RepID=A0AAP2GM27_9BACT|nr:Ezrin/radixin/moesin family protein [Chryseosolibacter histidini]MBT1701061.1 Ezrin/radixin/moesin family protein [Chryseosolibacter histidini]